MNRSLIATALLAACSHSAMAQSFSSSQSSEGACASLEIASSGRALRPIYFAGEQWIEGRPGAEYSLVLANRCPYRLLAVASVDGLDVVSGKPASFGSPGYILEPGARIPVDGWRKSGNSVAAFYFSSPRGSYASRTGQGENIGVIAAAFFRDAAEQRDNRWRDGDAGNGRSSLPMSAPAPASSAAGAYPAPPPPGSLGDSMAERSAMSTKSMPSLGTGHGRPISSPTTVGSFERESQPQFAVWRRYESRERLMEMGALGQINGPNAFPREPQYTPDPPRRYGR